jgi:hypothetical protein
LKLLLAFTGSIKFVLSGSVTEISGLLRGVSAEILLIKDPELKELFKLRLELSIGVLDILMPLDVVFVLGFSAKLGVLAKSDILVELGILVKLAVGLSDYNGAS